MLGRDFVSWRESAREWRRIDENTWEKELSYETVRAVRKMRRFIIQRRGEEDEIRLEPTELWYAQTEGREYGPFALKTAKATAVREANR